MLSDFLQSALSFLFFNLYNTVGVQCFRLRPEIGCFVWLFTMLCPVFTGFTSFFNKHLLCELDSDTDSDADSDYSAFGSDLIK